MTSDDVFDKTALITGASRGLGRSIAREFTRDGFNTLLCARDMDLLQELADELNEQHPGDSIAFPIDFTNSESLQDLSQAVPDQWPPISVLVNNAGVYFRGSLEETSIEEFRHQQEVNCMGPFILMKELVPQMARRGNGFVCNILATGALRGSSHHSAFNASKFGLRALTQSIAKEYQHKGVHVTGVIIDGQIDSKRIRSNQPDRDPETLLKPGSIAREILHLYDQPRDAWTLELDLRPHTEFDYNS
ncbi:MAG: SDR family oxidoreductase [bacterium]